MIVALGWDEIERDATALAAMLRMGPPIAGLIAVARGGLIPAALLARALDVRMVESIAVASYEGFEPGEPRLLKPAAVPHEGAGWLIVDDLVDLGTTARFVRGLLPRARFACLYAKPAGRPFADHVVRDYPQEMWLKFPWENGE
jgi:xanthine phosphoribosyltransferase